MDEAEREQFLKDLDTLEKAMFHEHSVYWSIPWGGQGYGGEKNRLEEGKLSALNQLWLAIKDQYEADMTSLGNIVRNTLGKHKDVLETEPFLGTNVNFVVETLNKPDVDWNLDNLNGDALKDIVERLKTISDDIVTNEQGQPFIPSYGIDPGFGVDKNERAKLTALTQLYNRYQLSKERAKIKVDVYEAMLKDKNLPGKDNSQ